MDNKKLDIIDAETLADMRLEPVKFCIENILPQGIAMISGAPKIGKSWLMLDWCLKIAKGEPVWNFKTNQGTTLYLCLEDNWNRIQNRLLNIADEVPNNLFFAVSSCSLADGLAEQMENFVQEHDDTVLIVIDTFQMVRSAEKCRKRYQLCQRLSGNRAVEIPCRQSENHCSACSPSEKAERFRSSQQNFRHDRYQRCIGYNAYPRKKREKSK